MLTELWIEGLIVEFKDGQPCGRAIIRHVGKNEIVLANIVNGATYKVERVDLDEMNENRLIKFLAESRDFGDLRFFDLTEKEQLDGKQRRIFPHSASVLPVKLDSGNSNIANISV